MSRIRRNLMLSLLTAAALIMFLLESQLPPLTSVPGIKPGLSNIFTLAALVLQGPAAACSLLLIRILLGSILTGQLSAAIYSLAGGMTAFVLMALLRRHFPEKQLWILSVLAAVTHNWGQLLAAVWITGAPQLLWYGLLLTAAAIASGSFTGFAAQNILLHLRKIKPEFFC